MEGTILLFCQAPGDIPYVLNEYESARINNKSVIIIVVNVYNCYKFLKELSLKTKDIVFIPYKLLSLKKIYLYPIEQIRLNSYYKKILHNNIVEVYFFSLFADWLTFFFVCKLLRKKIKTYYIAGNNKIDGREKETKIVFKKRVIQLLLYFLTMGGRFKFDIKNHPEYRFMYEDYHSLIRIDKNVSKDLYQRYSYKNTKIDARNAILFFINKCQDFFAHDSYYVILKKILSHLHEKGYYIVAKFHPREGNVEEISSYIDFELPIYVPAEFIDFSNFKICLGVDSTSIVKFINEDRLPTYSLLDFFEFNDMVQINNLRQLFVSFTNGKIIFIDNFQSLDNILKEFS